MPIEKIKEFSCRLGVALDSNDYEYLKSTSQECDKFIRSCFPIDLGKYKIGDVKNIVIELDLLSKQYHLAIENLEDKKNKTKEKLMALGKNKTNTNKYLDVAGNI